MNRYLELNAEGTVVNIIIWDGVSPYNYENNTLIPCSEAPNANYGWTLTDGVWIEPVKETVE